MKYGRLKFYWDVISAHIISADSTRTDNHRLITICEKVAIFILKGRTHSKSKAHILSIFIIRECHELLFSECKQ